MLDNACRLAELAQLGQLGTWRFRDEELPEPTLSEAVTGDPCILSPAGEITSCLAAVL